MNRVTLIIVFSSIIIAIIFIFGLFNKKTGLENENENVKKSSITTTKNTGTNTTLTKEPFLTPLINGVKSRAESKSEQSEYFLDEYTKEEPQRIKPVIEKSDLPFVEWQMKFGGSITHKPEIVNGNIYVATNDYQVHSLKTRSGSVVFSTPITSQPIGANLFMYENNLIVSQRDGSVDAIDLISGKQIWHHRSAVDKSGDTLDISISGISVNKDSFYVSKHWGNVYIGSLKTGATTETPGVTYESRIQLPTVFYKDIMIFTNVAGELHAFDLKGSKNEWVYTFENGYLLSLVENDGCLYGLNNLKELIKFDIETKTIKWKKPLLDVGYQSILIDKEMIYIAAGNLYGINKLDGNIIWQCEKKSKEGFKRPFTISDGIIYCSETNGLIYSINQKDGKVIKEWDIKEPVWSGISYDKGLIFIPTITKRIFAIKTY